VLRAAAILPLLVTLATGSVRSQASTDSATAVTAIRERLAHPKPAGARTRYAVNVVEVMVSWKRRPDKPVEDRTLDQRTGTAPIPIAH
jgi:hypothetical protein